MSLSTFLQMDVMERCRYIYIKEVFENPSKLMYSIYLKMSQKGKIQVNGDPLIMRNVYYDEREFLV